MIATLTEFSREITWQPFTKHKFMHSKCNGAWRYAWKFIWSFNFKCCCFIIWIEKINNLQAIRIYKKTPCNIVETNDCVEYDVCVSILIRQLKEPYFVSTDMKMDEGRNVRKKKLWFRRIISLKWITLLWQSPLGKTTTFLIF